MKNEGFGVNEPCDGRELVPLERIGAAVSSGAARPLAAFVVQLLASDARLAPFRARRRAKPENVHALYRREKRLPPPPRFERKL
jgi:hypothetical protein